MCNIETWKNIIELAFYLTGIIVALIGIKLWYRELKGKAHFQTARNILVSTYRVRDAISSCQSAFMFASEFTNRQHSTNETEEEKRLNDSYYAFSNRFKKVYEERANLYNYYVEAEAYFDKDAVKSINKLFRVINNLKVAIDLYHQFKLQNVGEDKMMRQFYNILYGITNYKKEKEKVKDLFDDDNFAKELDESITEIEYYFKKLIK